MHQALYSSADKGCIDDVLLLLCASDLAGSDFGLNTSVFSPHVLMFRLCSRPQDTILFKFCSLVLKDGGQSSEGDLRGGLFLIPVWVPRPVSCTAGRRSRILAARHQS